MKHFYLLLIYFFLFILVKSNNLFAQTQPYSLNSTSQVKKDIKTIATNEANKKVADKINNIIIKDTLKVIVDSVKIMQKKAEKMIKSAKNVQKGLSNNTPNQYLQIASQTKEQLTTTITNNSKISSLQDSVSSIIDSVKAAQTKINKIASPIKKAYSVVNNTLKTNPTNLNSLLNQQIEEIIPNVGVSKFKKIWDRTTYSLDLAFGSTDASSLIRLVPAMGVRVTKFYTMGIGFPMQHTNIGREVNKKSFEDFMYGVKLYHRFNLPKGLYVQLDNDFLNSKFSENQLREWTPAMWTGFGYNLKVAKNFGVSTMIMYNTLHKEQYTPYSLPLDIRVGFNWYQPTKPIFSKAKKLQQEMK